MINLIYIMVREIAFRDVTIMISCDNFGRLDLAPNIVILSGLFKIVQTSDIRYSVPLGI